MQTRSSTCWSHEKTRFSGAPMTKEYANNCEYLEKKKYDDDNQSFSRNNYNTIASSIVKSGSKSKLNYTDLI